MPELLTDDFQRLTTHKQPLQFPHAFLGIRVSIITNPQ